MAESPIIAQGRVSGSGTRTVPAGTAVGDSPAPVAWSASQVEELVTLPVLRESAALQVATVIRPAVGQRVEIPLITSFGDDEAGWVAEGANVPVIDGPDLGTLVIDHYKVAAQARISWEALSDHSFDVSGIIGQGIVAKIANTIDYAYFTEDPDAQVPVVGIGRTTGVHTIANGPIKNLDVFLDAIAHATALDTTVTNFVCHPDTVTALAKIKKQTGSLEPLLGTTEAPGAMAIAGVPIVATRHVPTTTIWAIPRDRTIVSMRQDVTVQSDPTAYWATMQTGLMGYARFGMGCTQPEAVTKITL